jgi:Protein of unknown function (DUF2786)
MSSTDYTANHARRKMLERVKALLAKTIVNGCTEGEAMAALGKARELMEAYEFSESDLLPENEKAQILAAGQVDPYGIKRKLTYAVGKFTRCQSWQDSVEGVTFCGLDSDVAFATWLLGTLQDFVLREVRSFRAELLRDSKRAPRIMSSSFVHGATGRISDRLHELTPAEPVGTGLVISRNALIDAAMSAAGITLKTTRSSRIYINREAFDAGQAAGNAASFSLPVDVGAAPLRLAGTS